MIKITEAKCNELPGLTSLFLSIPYNKDIINTIKAAGSYNYNPKTKLWEFPVSKLAYLIDNLCYFDDVHIELCSDNNHANKRVIPRIKYKLQPFKHQMEAIEYGLNNDKWLLLDMPGLGKTKSIIHIAEELKLQKKLEHCLIICGINSIKGNWEKEIKIHSNESSIIIGKKVSDKGRVSYTSIKDRIEQIKNKIDEFFVIVNVETLRDPDFVKAINSNKNNKFDMIVIDEAHMCKTPGSKQSNGLLKLKKAKYKIAATGTLLLNNPLDAYIPLKWIDKENSTFTQFKNFYSIFSDKFPGLVIGIKNTDIIKDQIASCSLRRTKDLLDLPDKTFIKEYVEMNDKHRELYDNVKQGIKTDIDKVRLNKKNLLALTTRLRQATACPSILTSSDVKSSKIERCLSLIDEIISNGDEVIVFSTYKETLHELIKNISPEYKPILITGDTKDSEVDALIDEFKTNKNSKVLLATWQKMGTGHTLTKASYMIFLDTPWTWGVFDQACDRIHRIGASKNVFIYNLICKDTIDERVQEILEDKKQIADYIIDDKIDINDSITQKLIDIFDSDNY